MFRLSQVFILLSLLSFSYTSIAQPTPELSATRFQVRGYNINDFGYPGAFKPGPDRRFYYL
ncbi:MAG: hypothetical protein ACOCZ8_00640, partial [Bacteroidota bacterium]